MLLGSYRPGSIEDFERLRWARRVRRTQARVTSDVWQSPRLAVPQLVDDPIDLLFREHRLLPQGPPPAFVRPVEPPPAAEVELRARSRSWGRSLRAGLAAALTVKGGMVLTAAAALAVAGALVAIQPATSSAEPPVAIPSGWPHAPAVHHAAAAPPAPVVLAPAPVAPAPVVSAPVAAPPSHDREPVGDGTDHSQREPQSQPAPRAPDGGSDAPAAPPPRDGGSVQGSAVSAPPPSRDGGDRGSSKAASGQD